MQLIEMDYEQEDFNEKCSVDPESETNIKKNDKN